MRLQALTVLALSCALAPFAFSQDSGTSSGKPLRHPPKPGQSTELPESAASVKPNDAVITLDGSCKSANQSDCVAAISREQFEKMASAIKPTGMTADARRNFGLQYGKIVAFADQARALDLEDTPRFKEIIKYVTDQLLVESLNEHYSTEYNNQPDQKIEEYYKQNSGKYREADIQRIIIPSQPAAADITKPLEAEQKAYMEKLRQQWVAGADPATLQKEAFSRMGLNGSAPDINLKGQTSAMIPPDQSSVFDMKPGEVSKPFVDTGAGYLYKMVVEHQKPLSEVKEQIVKTLHDQMLREKLEQLSESAKPVLNDAYFGPEKKPEDAQTGEMRGVESSGKAGSPQPTPPQK